MAFLYSSYNACCAFLLPFIQAFKRFSLDSFTGLHHHECTMSINGYKFEEKKPIMSKPNSCRDGRDFEIVYPLSSLILLNNGEFVIENEAHR